MKTMWRLAMSSQRLGFNVAVRETGPDGDMRYVFHVADAVSPQAAVDAVTVEIETMPTWRRSWDIVRGPDAAGSAWGDIDALVIVDRDGRPRMAWANFK
ncbi:MAG: hypothetical protein ABI652_04050 [Acidobacteriota bacterium]